MHITHPFGGAENTYRSDAGLYCVANLDVAQDKRRQGIGKLLLEASHTHALKVGARAIYGAIISRECLDAMRSVFGTESVTIDLLGSYAAEGEDYPKANPTSATLFLPLEFERKQC